MSALKLPAECLRWSCVSCGLTVCSVGGDVAGRVV
jgi:hypothetical protein